MTNESAIERPAYRPHTVSALFHLIPMLAGVVPAIGLADIEINGGLTMIGQGVSGVSEAEATSGFNYSVDLQLTSDVGDGTLFIYLDTAEGADAFSGANADFEGGSLDDGGFSRTGIAEAWYQLPVMGALKLTAGKIDPTGIYDGNDMANDQTSQFLANDFVNNAAIPFPAYTLGLNAGYEFSEDFSINVGVFEDEGLQGPFENTFSIGELALGMELLGGKNNVRLTYWHSTGAGENTVNSGGSGYAVNTDLDWGTVKLFLRYGAASLNDIAADASQEDIDAADRRVKTSFSLGLGYQLSDGMLIAGAYAVDTPQSDILDSRSWLEVYLNIELDENLAVALDYQTIAYRDFDAGADNVSVYGARLQVGF